MTAEIHNLDLYSVERKFEEREFKLPNGIRKYIRRLKQEGKLSEALRVKSESTEKKRTARQRLQDKLDENSITAIVSDDPQKQALSEFTATWLLSLTGEISTEERQVDLGKVYDTHPDQEDNLSAVASSIVIQVSKLAKEAGNS